VKHRLPSFALGAAFALSASACDSGSATPTTLTTAPPTRTAGSETPDAAGAYRTVSFMPELRVDLPRGWAVASDAGGELDLHFGGPGGGDMRVSKGLFPVNGHGEFLTARMSPAVVLEALTRNPALVTARVGVRRLGDGLRAVVVDIAARSEGRVPYLAYKGVGLAGVSFEADKGNPDRVYVALVRAPYGLDLLNVSVSAAHPRDLADLAARAEKVLRTLILPPGVRAVR